MFRFMQMLGSRVPTGFSSEGVNVKALLKRFHEDEEGQGMTEYIHRHLCNPRGKDLR